MDDFRIEFSTECLNSMEMDTGEIDSRNNNIEVNWNKPEPFSSKLKTNKQKPGPLSSKLKNHKQKPGPLCSKLKPHKLRSGPLCSKKDKSYFIDVNLNESEFVSNNFYNNDSNDECGAHQNVQKLKSLSTIEDKNEKMKNTIKSYADIVEEVEMLFAKNFENSIRSEKQSKRPIEQVDASKTQNKRSAKDQTKINLKTAITNVDNSNNKQSSNKDSSDKCGNYQNISISLFTIEDDNEKMDYANEEMEHTPKSYAEIVEEVEMLFDENAQNTSIEQVDASESNSAKNQREMLEIAKIEYEGEILFANNHIRPKLISSAKTQIEQVDVSKTKFAKNQTKMLKVIKSKSNNLTNKQRANKYSNGKIDVHRKILKLKSLSAIAEIEDDNGNEDATKSIAEIIDESNAMSSTIEPTERQHEKDVNENKLKTTEPNDTNKNDLVDCNTNETAFEMDSQIDEMHVNNSLYQQFIDAATAKINEIYIKSLNDCVQYLNDCKINSTEPILSEFIQKYLPHINDIEAIPVAAAPPPSDITTESTNDTNVLEEKEGGGDERMIVAVDSDKEDKRCQKIITNKNDSNIIDITDIELDYFNHTCTPADNQHESNVDLRSYYSYDPMTDTSVLITEEIFPRYETNAFSTNCIENPLNPTHPSNPTDPLDLIPVNSTILNSNFSANNKIFVYIPNFNNNSIYYWNQNIMRKISFNYSINTKLMEILSIHRKYYNNNNKIKELRKTYKRKLNEITIFNCKEPRSTFHQKQQSLINYLDKTRSNINIIDNFNKMNMNCNELIITINIDPSVLPQFIREQLEKEKM